ncbi:MAG: hypothetical protein WC582_02910 [Patescibacteria group bacterium]
MSGAQIGQKSITVLSQDFTIPGTEITLKSGTEINKYGFNDTHFQCLVSGRFVWVPKNITKTE